MPETVSQDNKWIVYYTRSLNFTNYEAESKKTSMWTYPVLYVQNKLSGVIKVEEADAKRKTDLMKGF